MISRRALLESALFAIPALAGGQSPVGPLTVLDQWQEGEDFTDTGGRYYVLCTLLANKQLNKYYIRIDIAYYPPDTPVYGKPQIIKPEEWGPGSPVGPPDPIGLPPTFVPYRYTPPVYYTPVVLSRTLGFFFDNATD